MNCLSRRYEKKEHKEQEKEDDVGEDEKEEGERSKNYDLLFLQKAASLRIQLNSNVALMVQDMTSGNQSGAKLNQRRHRCAPPRSGTWSSMSKS